MTKRLIAVTIIAMATISLLPACTEINTKTASVIPSYTSAPPSITSPMITLVISPTPTDSVGVTSVTAQSVSGLSLSLVLNSYSFLPGQEISVSVDEQNTHTTVNNIPVSDKWPLKGLSLGPCSGATYCPFGVAFFPGYYSSADVSTATLLQFYDPNQIYMCPRFLNLTASDKYAFQPSSDIASIFVDGDFNHSLPDINTNYTVKVQGYWKGYWIGSQETKFSNFTPGVYTVAGGDEWGTLAVLHFVIQAGKST